MKRFKLGLLFLICLFSICANSQARYKGYYITSANDTINGYFVEYNEYSGYKSFHFSDKKWGETKRKNHKDAISYNNGSYHKRFPSLKKVFLKRTVSGKLNIYTWRKKGQVPIPTGVGAIVLKYEENTFYLQFKGEEKIHLISKSNPAFRKKIDELIGEEYPDIIDQIKENKWNAKELDKIVRLYNRK